MRWKGLRACRPEEGPGEGEGPEDEGAVGDVGDLRGEGLEEELEASEEGLEGLEGLAGGPLVEEVVGEGGDREGNENQV